MTGISVAACHAVDQISHCFQRETGMGIVCENGNFRSNETDFPQGKRIVYGWKKLGVHRKGSTGFSSIPNTQETRVCSHVAIASLSHLICDHSCWLLLSQAGISTEHCSHSYMLLHHVLTKKKANVLKVLNDPLCCLSCQPWQKVWRLWLCQ